MLDQKRFLRQLDIIKPEELQTLITIIGIGGIGSPLALELAKMGCQNIILYDNDTVEDHNLPNQMFREKDIGKSKTEAEKDIVKEFTGLDVVVNSEEYKQQELSGIVISAVHDMKTRKAIWKNVKSKPQIKLYIDARMGGEVGRIFSVFPCDPDDIDSYESTLYSDKEAEELPCTARSIIYNVFGLASLIGVLVKKKAKGEQLPKEIIFDFSKPLLVVRGLSEDSKDKKTKK